MKKHIKGAKSVPSLPPRRPLPPGLEETGLRSHTPSIFPPLYKLVVTTTKGMYDWDGVNSTEIFHAGSDGIVAAKRLTGDKDMLAIADSQVVVLHDVKDKTQRSYRLKGSEGQVRLLKYDKDSDRLFFTTTLRNTVQAYSLRDSELLDTYNDHPTPPAVFALSCDCRFLVSTSTAPPTIYLTDIKDRSQPVLVRPECSASAVVAVAFHPERASYFLLAFADGTAALFDAAHFFQKHTGRDRGLKAAIAGAGGILAFIRRLHTQGTGISFDRDGLDDLDIRKLISGRNVRCCITAVAFVPGRKATIITVGADGKCCIVDFTQNTKRKAVLLRSWHLRRPATSVSVIYYKQGSNLSQVDGYSDVAAPNADILPDKAYCVAIGREDGRVLLFDLNGKHLGEQVLNNDGAPIIDVEWLQAKSNDIFTQRRNSSPPMQNSTGIGTQRDFTEGIKTGAKGDSFLLPTSQPEVSKSNDQSRTLFDLSDPQKTLLLPTQDSRPEESVTAANHLDFIESPPTSSEGTSTSDLTAQSSDSVSTNSYDEKLQEEVGLDPLRQPSVSPKIALPDRSAIPPVPPRPTPRPGGLLSKRRAQSSYGSVSDDSYSTLIASARRVKSNNVVSRPGNFFGPRPKPTHERHSPSRAASFLDQSYSERMANQPQSDIPPTPPPHRYWPQRKSPAASTESFQTASSHVNSLGQSEGSTDTVIEWDVAQTRQAFPSMNEEPHFTKAITVRAEPPKKGHISLSVLTASCDTPLPTSSAATNDPSPIVQWAETSPPYSAPGLHAAQRPTESPAGPKTKQKGHTSIPISSTSKTSMTTISPASSGAIVQWPSLKKSPRIPELNKALSSSGRGSVPRQARDESLSMRSPPRAASTETHAVARSQSSTYSSKIEVALSAAMSSFRTEMAQKFEEQRMWLEDLIRSEDEGRILLEEENRWLRAELDKYKGVE